MSSSQRVRNYRERQRALGRRERWITDQEMKLVHLFRKKDASIGRFFKENQGDLYEDA